MKIYVEIIIENIHSAQSEVLIALLSNIGFDGFEETNHSLKAFIHQENFDEEIIRQLAAQHHFVYEVKKIEEQNWNALWESNFEPVMIDDFVFVRAAFHAPAQQVQHEIIITPKMSFGTGHHATTYMMMQQMRTLDFNHKRVFDFGTGTGVLAILAEKLGASDIFATDNDDWSVENAMENIRNNHCKKIEVVKAGGAQAALQSQKFDIVLANINKNVILENARILSEILLKEGNLLLSGLLTEDEAAIVKAFTAVGLQHRNTEYREQWISLLWSKC